MTRDPGCLVRFQFSKTRTTNEMKLLQLTRVFYTFFGLSSASSYFDNALGTELENFDLDYSIEEYPDIAYNDVAEMDVGEQIKLLHNFSNRENKDITIVGLGGAFRDAITGEPLVNLTSTTVGPIIIPPGESSIIGQKINLDFGGGNFLLSPRVFVAFNDEVKVVQARPQLTVIKEKPLSFFDPQLMFLEVLLLLATGIGLYVAVPSIFSEKKVSPVQEKSTKSTGFDPSWVPSHHQHTQKKSKTRKAY